MSTINCMTKSMWTPARWTSHSKIMDISRELLPPLLLKQSPLFWEDFPLDVRTLLQGLLLFSHKSISEVGHWCWVIRPGSQLVFQFIPKVFDGVEVRALCRPVEFFHTELNKPFLYGPRFGHGALSCWNRKGPSPNCCHKIGSTESYIYLLYAIALRFPFSGTKGLSPNYEK